MSNDMDDGSSEDEIGSYDGIYGTPLIHGHRVQGAKNYNCVQNTERCQCNKQE